MKDYQVGDIRNIVVTGHGSEGKTTLVEAMLYAAGVIDRQGKVEDGGTVTDHDPEEQKRQISISAAVAPVEVRDHKINLIDIPGYFDFIGEMMGPLRVADASIIVVNAVSGPAVGTEKAWELCGKNGVPRMIVVNGMDREHADFDKVIDALRERFGQTVVPVQIPIISGGAFTGVCNLLTGKAYEGAWRANKEVPAPGGIDSAREAIMEAAAGSDEELMEKFFENGELSGEETIRGLRMGIREGLVVPVVCVSALSGVGVLPLVDAIIDLMPSPAEKAPQNGVNPKTDEPEERSCDPAAPFSAQVLKTLADPFVGKLSIIKVVSGTLSGDLTLYNANSEKNEKMGTIYVLTGKKQTTVDKLVAGDIGALAKLTNTATGHTLCDASKPVRFDPIDFPEPSISMAVYAKKEGDEDKVFGGLSRLMEEDPTIRVAKDIYTSETVLSGLGELHIEVIAKKLQSKFGAEVVLQDPKIPYRETIRKSVKAEGRHKKQSGGHGQFGHVWIEFEPILDGSAEFEFVDKVVGGVVPRNFIPAVEKGLRENLGKGVLAGFPMVNFRATLYDGSYHSVDSSEMAFKTAARLAYKKGCLQASPVLLEPIYRVVVRIPDEYMGDIIGDINKRRGRVLGMDQVDGKQQVEALVPQAEMFKYATDLRSMTQARGSFTMAFETYEEVPGNIAQKVVEAHKKDEDEDE